MATTSKKKESVSTAKKSTAKKKAAKKSTKKAATKTTAKKAATKKDTPKKSVTPKKRFELIQETAYFMAQKNNFEGDQAEYWLQAEAEVDKQLKAQS